ncbi:MULTISPECIES: hypothetical protein [Saccharothrix]|uniref:hypothetical protein n=1 Tax=Saccharothrix TaxID=2071 RepID=UPI00094005F1|nr:hypothetical protein [Saccharothrix sp. CB00851]OKI13868.1 hypothetical protein A6A25_16495 [Saccharothrix sp. CB00851]
MSRPRFLLLLAVPAVVVVLTAVLLTGESDLPVADLPPTPTVVATLTLEPGVPAAGDEVVVRAAVAADRQLTVRAITVQVVQRSTNAPHDFDELPDHAIGTTTQEITFRRTFDTPGRYTYYLAYRLGDEDWVRLKPWQTFTVR